MRGASDRARRIRGFALVGSGSAADVAAAPGDEFDGRIKSRRAFRRLDLVIPSSGLPPRRKGRRMKAMGTSSPPGLRRLRLKPEDCAPADLFAKWRGALGEVFEVRATPSEIAAFRGEIDVHASAHYVLSASWHSPLSFIRRCASGGAERFAISLKIEGSASGLAGDGPMQTGPGDVLFVDLTQALAMRESAPEGFVGGVTLWTARERILPLVLNENALHGLVLKADEPAGAVIGATLRAFAKMVPDMRLADFDALAEGLIALAAKSAAPAVQGHGDAAASLPLATFVTVRRYIDRNL